ncbi:MAG: Hpt domain-containing protein [Planctomycetes bacterium]|nr:Hpt domain-containing protein [Planctomycetota bacterium]
MMGDSIWNKALILETVGDDDEMMQELIELFFEDTDQRLANMAAAIEQDDYGVLRAEAHAIKGAAGSFGAERLHKHCERFERCTVDEDHAAIVPSWEILRGLYEELRSVVVPC